MLNFKTRYTGFELLDANNISSADLFQNLKELNTINRYLGGHAITLKGFQKLAKFSSTKKITIAEIGCGGGDNLKVLAAFCEKQKWDCEFIGMDLKQDCIDFAKQNWNSSLPVKWVCTSYELALQNRKVDIVFNSLFCHHFTEIQIVEMMNWMNEKSNLGFFINDLQRSKLAYFLIKWITNFFSTSYLVKHDAPVSVARSFTKQDWLKMSSLAKSNVVIQWKWAFRYLVSFKKSQL